MANTRLVCHCNPTTLYSRDMERAEKIPQATGSEPRAPRRLSFEESTQPLALHYRPEFLAKGGEHLVYEIPVHQRDGQEQELRNVVVKLNKQSVLDTLALANDLGLAPNSDDPKLVAELQMRLEYKRKMQAALRECFGSEHVVPQKYFLQTVPLPHGIIEELGKLNKFYAKELPKDDVRESKAILAIQPYLVELKDWHLSVTAGIAEWRPNFVKLIKKPEYADEYAMVTDDLMSAQSARDYPPEEDSFFRIIRHPKLIELLELAKEDAGLKDAIRHFIESAVDFAEKTGEIIDYGKDNVIFFQTQDHGWTYLIVDGLYGLQEDILDTGKEALHLLQQGANPASLTNYEGNAIFQAINFTRTTNGIGALVGAKKFYTLFPSDEGRVSKLLSVFYPSLKEAA